MKHIKPFNENWDDDIEEETCPECGCDPCECDPCECDLVEDECPHCGCDPCECEDYIEEDELDNFNGSNLDLSLELENKLRNLPENEKSYI